MPQSAPGFNLPCMASSPVIEPVRAPFAFGQIVCAVDGSRGGREAVHQATQLMGPLDTLTFIAVTDTLNEAQAARAVDAAGAAARADGIEATTLVVNAQDVGSTLLEAAHHAGLLVVGAHSGSRMAGFVVGRSPVPVLVARSLPELRFPGVALVGTRGLEDRHAAVVAATIAARHDTRVVLAHVGQSGAILRHALAEMAAEVRDITGKDPVVVSVGGHPAHRLTAMARSVGAGLVVLGSRGRRHPHELTSASEHVAQRAVCSVLVLTPAAENYGRGWRELRSAVAYRSRMDRALQATVMVDRDGSRSRPRGK